MPSSHKNPDYAARDRGPGGIPFWTAQLPCYFLLQVDLVDLTVSCYVLQDAYSHTHTFFSESVKHNWTNRNQLKKHSCMSLRSADHPGTCKWRLRASQRPQHKPSAMSKPYLQGKNVWTAMGKPDRKPRHSSRRDIKNDLWKPVLWLDCRKLERNGCVCPMTHPARPCGPLPGRESCSASSARSQLAIVRP